MKVNFFISGIIALMFFAAEALAQPAAIPTPPDLTQYSGSDNAQTDVQDAPSEDPKTAQARLLATQMIDFFDGLDRAISEHDGDCPAVSDALRDYYTAHQDWIHTLDYASVDIDAQTVDEIHARAIDLGKKLSACYDQKTIPELLKRFSKQ
ncbi:MAG: hypothetical protein IKY83_06580 [Proteobacteria bacterium]|nr:hypothetical protein [Pseudomonadota bacterium]